jgi:8-oxo-dGTP pyrophosphatase MutT (NUDIX family)
MTAGPAHPPAPGDAAPGRYCAGALLLCGERYLMQLRDANPAIMLPDHWALFGGSIDPGEAPREAILRELIEELEFRPTRVEPFSEMTLVLPLDPPRADRLCFFVVPCTESEIAAMVQHEGADMRLFTPEELAAEPRVAPWDLAAVLMHARRADLFPG